MKKQSLYEFTKEALQLLELKDSPLSDWQLKEHCGHLEKLSEQLNNNPGKKLVMNGIPRNTNYKKIPSYKKIAPPTNKTVLIIDDPNPTFEFK